MKKLALVLALVLAASPALAISRYNPLAMTCQSARAAIHNEGAVIFRWTSPRGLPIYARYIRNSRYCDAHEYAEALTGLGLPGVSFRPARFRPTLHKWARQLCGGVQVHVTDVDRFRPFLTGLGLIVAARATAPRGFAWRPPPYEFERRRKPFDILCGTDTIRLALDRKRPLVELERQWRRPLSRWMRTRRRFLLYE